MRILIVGAGIGGLTAALALLRDGHEVEVYEQAPRLAELGAGVQISANGARVLFALGLESALRKVWCEPAGKEIRLWNTGETWKLFDLGAESVARYGAPYFMIHRADLHQVLIDAVRAIKPDAIRLDARCTGFDDDGRSVTLRLANGERVTGDALIGADGVHSRHPQAIVRRRHRAVHRLHGLARADPGREAAAALLAQRRRQLGRAGRPRHQLSAAAGRAVQFRRHRGARRLARRILDREGHARGMRRGLLSAGTMTSTN